MPTSDYHHISDVLHVIQQSNPRSVLDIGVGFGKWGALCREVLDVYQGRLQPKEWATRIEGIEIFEGYRNPLWNFAYNQVFIGDASDSLNQMGRYDVILACDVIEHLDKVASKLLVENMLHHADLVIITSPRGYAPQGVKYGNEHEAHKSEWSQKDFSDLPHLYKDIGFTFMAVLSLDHGRLGTIEVHHPLHVLGVKKGMAELMKLAVKRVKYRIEALIASSL